MKHKKTIQAGRLIIEAVYPVAQGSSEKTRAGKMKLTSAAQQRMNQKYSYQKLACILAANFPRKSDVVTLTYDPDLLPAKRQKVEADLKAFRARMAKEWKRHGKVFKMAWAIEHDHGNKHWHVHCVINAATTNDRMIIEKHWGKGRVHLEHLKTDRSENHISLAKYMAKEYSDRENSKRAWSYTRSCVQASTYVDRCISDNETLQLPKGAMLIDSESHSNEFGSWEYIQYYIPEDAPQRTQKRFGLKQNLL